MKVKICVYLLMQIAAVTIMSFECIEIYAVLIGNKYFYKNKNSIFVCIYIYFCKKHLNLHKSVLF